MFAEPHESRGSVKYPPSLARQVGRQRFQEKKHEREDGKGRWNTISHVQSAADRLNEPNEVDDRLTHFATNTYSSFPNSYLGMGGHGGCGGDLAPCLDREQP